MATRKTTKKEVVDINDNSVIDATDKPEKLEEKPKKVNKNRITRIPLDIEVPCINNTTGTLIYKSSRQGGLDAEWEGYKSVQYLDLRELMMMRNTAKRFFTDNWIVLGDTDDGEYSGDDIYAYLRVDEYYNNSYTPDNVEEFFELTGKQMLDKASKLSRGMKELLSVLAIDKMERGEIDSISKIRDIETALGFKFNKEEEG